MTLSNNATSLLRNLITSGEFMPMPCCFDALSAKLIEQAGFKGLKNGKVGMHKKQALVLVNYGTSSGKLLWKHAKYVMEGVEKKFGITLETEVNLIC